MLELLMDDGALDAVSERLEEVGAIVAALGTAELSFSFDRADVTTQDGYAVCAQTYDTGDNPLIAVEEPVVARILRDLPPGRALDVACGTGRVARLLRGMGHQVVGVDSSGHMLAAAGLSFGVALGDLFRLPVRDGCADTVTCCLALTHQRDLQGAFDEFARVLRPGGTLVTSDIHVATLPLGGTASVDVDGQPGVMPSFRHWPSAYITATVAAGFEVVGCAEPCWEPDGGGLLARQWCPTAADVCYAGVPAAVVWRFARR
jgi:SAM-dependent methyltransferase